MAVLPWRLKSPPVKKNINSLYADAGPFKPTLNVQNYKKALQAHFLSCTCLCAPIKRVGIQGIMLILWQSR